MLAWMKNLKISHRIYLLVGLFMVALAIATSMSISSITSTRNHLRADQLATVVETAKYIAQAAYDRVQAGELDEETAKAQVMQTLGDMRYGNNEYLFINALDGVMLMHPIKPDMVGVDQMTMEDANGKRFVAEMVNIAKTQGSGLVEYTWTRPGSDEPVPKFSYVAAFAPWGWAIGTGIYVDDLNAENMASLIEQLTTGGVIMLIMIGVAFLISNTITKPITLMTQTMNKMAEGEYDLEVPAQKQKDEIGTMAKSVEVFRQNGLRVREMTAEEAARIERSQMERAKMMQDLQVAFGEVVDAAVAGDFAKRVTTEFPDDELNALAKSVNNLVETVDRGLEETGSVLSALADTNLTRRVEGQYAGAFEKLKSDTNAVADKLTDIIGQLKQTSRGLKTATGEILSGANDLSERTTKQAATIEETSAAMEQLASTVKQNAERAEEASVKTQSMSRSAEEGGEVMGRANAAMEQITQSSSKISNIIGMIDDIAFQTNLLALNASVEAARAGEAGKGFAVVAVEVRRLAQSAAEASSEVKALIEQSGEEVAGGTKLVASAAEKLSAILEAVKENNILMEGIAKESREQASAIDEVNVAVRQMDEMTQHNAALVEETNAAIEQTETQAADLDRIVDIFQLTETGRTSGVKPPETGAKPGMLKKVASGARALLTRGNAAVDADWEAF